MGNLKTLSKRKVLMLTAVAVLFAYLLSPNNSIILKGFETDYSHPDVSFSIYNYGPNGEADGLRVLSEPPYRIVVNVSPDDSQVDSVYVKSLTFHACGEEHEVGVKFNPREVSGFGAAQLHLEYSVIKCHEDFHMDISLDLLSENGDVIQSVNDSVLFEATIKRPSKISNFSLQQ